MQGLVPPCSGQSRAARRPRICKDSSLNRPSRPPGPPVALQLNKAELMQPPLGNTKSRCLVRRGQHTAAPRGLPSSTFQGFGNKMLNASFKPTPREGILNMIAFGFLRWAGQGFRPERHGLSFPPPSPQPDQWVPARLTPSPGAIVPTQKVVVRALYTPPSGPLDASSSLLTVPFLERSSLPLFQLPSTGRAGFGAMTSERLPDHHPRLGPHVPPPLPRAWPTLRLVP